MHVSGDSGSGGLTDAVSDVIDSVTGGAFSDDEDDGSGSHDEGENDNQEASGSRPDGAEKTTASVEHVRRYELGDVSSSNEDRRYIQTVLPVGTETYVFGGAERDEALETADEPIVLRTDPSTGEFIVSDRAEFELARMYRSRSLVYIVAGLVTSAMLLALLAQILLTGPVYGIDAAMP